jgi:hypothetical protein
MLVDMGDLPQPDNNVLSETLWNSEGNSGSSIPHAAMSAYHGAMPIGVGRPPGTADRQIDTHHERYSSVIFFLERGDFEN